VFETQQQNLTVWCTLILLYLIYRKIWVINERKEMPIKSENLSETAILLGVFQNIIDYSKGMLQ
jgi:hypothetical protein